jgi:dienelactone hydrolase
MLTLAPPNPSKIFVTKRCANLVVLPTMAALALAGSLVATSALTLLAATGSQPSERTAPVPTGPHAVGRRLATWIDHDRRDPTDGARPRELAVWIWYPAAVPMLAGDAAPEPSLPGSWGERRLETLEARLGANVAEALRELRVNARTDAPVVPGTSRMPVILFTPGLGWLPTDYSVLVEDLASHGYVVVGLAAPGFAEVVRMSDGREVRRTLGMGAAIGADQTHLFDDALFALRRIRGLDDDATGFLRDRLDRDRIGTLGHSIGGITSVVAAARNSSVRAAINIDGDPMAEAVDARPHQPLLLISSESPTIEEAPGRSSAEQMALMQQGLERSEKRRTNDWIRMSADAARSYRIRLTGSRHLNFTDAALASSVLVTPQERWMKMGPIAGDRGLTVTAALVRSFFALTLLGTGDDALLRAPDLQVPEAILETAADDRIGN